MSAFKVDVCFGVDIAFDYFDIDLLLDALQISSDIKNSKRIVKLVREHGKRHRIIQIAKRQMALDIVSDYLDGSLSSYDPFFNGQRVLSSTQDRHYDAEERLLQICLSIATGKSIKGLKKLNNGFDSKEIRSLRPMGKSVFSYFRNILNSNTRDYIIAFKQGKGAEESDPIQAQTETSPSSTAQASTKSKARFKDRTTDFNSEIKTVAELFSEGQHVLLDQVKLMKTGAPLNVGVMKRYCNLMIRSYDRNPYALLALRHVKDPNVYLLQHMLSSAVLGIHFSRILGLSEEYVTYIAMGGLLFDIGRFRLPDAISNKTTKLTTVEFDLFRKHIDFALSTIKNTDGLPKLVYQMIDDHHEKIDGTGYPKGKQDKEISVYGKMAAIIDAYDAMTSEQQHKSSMGPVRACQQLMKESNLAFDGELVKTFVRSMGQFPVGTCVSLSNGRIGFVITLNKNYQPAIVRQVFSTTQNAFIPVTDISVDRTSTKRVDVSIMNEVNPDSFGIQFINHLQ